MGLRRLRSLRRDLRHAASYAEWKALAQAIDAETGADAWRANPESPFFDAKLLQEHTRALRDLRERKQLRALLEFGEQSVLRHHGDVRWPGLYAQALAGTKHVVEAWLDELAAGLEAVANTTEWSHNAKRSTLNWIDQRFGRPALLLSGGATMGLFHFGVAKALWQHDLLPNLICGSSVGAIAAASICTRTDPELREGFENPDVYDTNVLRLLSPREMLDRRALFDADVLARAIRHNVGDHTFAEAYAKTGRMLCIAVSATRPRQQPRILNHFNTPDVLVASATSASASIPIVFAPAALHRRDERGHTQMYCPDERWHDGSIDADVPLDLIDHLHTVDFRIVSQTNPHLVPVVNLRKGRGPVAFGMDGAFTATSAALQAAASFAGRRLPLGAPGRVAGRIIHAMTAEYEGDVTLSPPARPWNYSMVLRNANPAQFRRLAEEGERATWPHLPRIADQTRLGRTLAACLAQVERESRAANTSDAG